MDRLYLNVGKPEYRQPDVPPLFAQSSHCCRKKFCAHYFFKPIFAAKALAISNSSFFSLFSSAGDL